tara:strand:- start:943 stop:1230 length:288 start_codon:yes stop_codon:yes gene_type:complete
MYSTEYKIGDLVHLSPSDIIYMSNGEDCGVGPCSPTRFGLAVSDSVCGLIIDIKEEPNLHGEILLLVGLQECWMTYAGSEVRPMLKIIGKTGEDK